MSWLFYDNRGVVRTDSIPADPVVIGMATMFVAQDAGIITPPTGWLVADGQAHNVASYPDLASLYGATGIGDGLYDNAPAAGKFNVPNCNITFPIGSSSVFSTGSRDVSLSRSSHNHGGASSPAHRHRIDNTHTHTMPSHLHTMDNHTHISYHRHGIGSLNVALSTTDERVRDTTPDTSVARWDHDHNINGGQSGYGKTVGGSQVIHSADNTNTTSAGGGTTTSIQWSVGNRLSNNTNAGVSNPGDILPPYLNVTFIIKAL